MCSKKIACLGVFVAVAVGLLSLPGVAGAAYNWLGTGDDNLWSNPDNWNDTVPGAGNIAVFSDPSATGQTVDLGASDITVAGVEFNSNLAGGNIIAATTDPAVKLILTATSTAINVTGGSHTISAPIGGITNGTIFTTVAGASLTTSGNITTTFASGDLNFEKRGPGVWNVTGQLFDAADPGAINKIIKPLEGTTNFTNATVYTTSLISQTNGNAYVTMTNSVININDTAGWGHGGLFVGYGNGFYSYAMNGGSLTLQGPGIKLLEGGNTGRAILSLDGEATVISPSIMVANNDNCIGVLNVRNANVTNNGNFRLGGSKAMGIVNQFGGTIDNGGSLNLDYRMNQWNNWGIYNLIGGTLKTTRITSGDGTANFSAGNQAYFNFHGGTLSPKATSSNFIYSTLIGASAGTVSAPQLMVYSEGAVIDTATFDITISEPFIAPPGQGVSDTTIPIAPADQGSGYKGEPVILVNRGAGDTTGVVATAVANMEDDGLGNGTFMIASITITNPGVNYTAAPTLSIPMNGGDATTPAVLPALTIADNVSGGLTKKGEGILTLSAANTYTGPTNVEAGTLALAGDFTNNIASSRKINIAGGAFLDVAGLTGGSGGAIVIGAGQTLKGNGTDTLISTVTGNVEMAMDSVFEWEFTGAATGGSIDVTGNLKLDTGWKLSLVDSGGGAAPGFGSKYDLFTYGGTCTGVIEGIIDFTPDGWPTPKIAQDGATGTIYVMFGSNGDINGDGVVDATDYIILKQHFGQPTAAGENGDFDGDGMVEFDDLQTLITALNPVVEAPTAPEPCSAMLLVFGAAALFRRRRS